jgi:hypothetical protein
MNYQHYDHIKALHDSNSLERELELNARNVRAIRRHAECQIPKLKVTITPS